MDAYLLVKTIHIISATILFGTGIDIAAFMFVGLRSVNPVERRFAARITVWSDFVFTLPAVIVQPLTGFWLVVHGGYAWNEAWLRLAIALYVLAAICWLPVVAMQIRMRHMLEDQVRGLPFDERAFQRLFGLWFILGWPAFGGLLVVFWLMVAKPTW